MQEIQKTQFHSWVRKRLWKRKWLPTPAFLPGESQGQRRLIGYNPWGLKDSDTTWPVSMHAFLHIYYLIAFPSSESKAKVQLCPLNSSLLIIRRSTVWSFSFSLPTSHMLLILFLHVWLILSLIVCQYAHSLPQILATSWILPSLFPLMTSPSPGAHDDDTTRPSPAVQNLAASSVALSDPLMAASFQHSTSH